MTNEKSEITLILKIVLPFWIDISNNTIFKKEYNRIKYKIEILQNLWQVNYLSNFQRASFLIQEEGVISRGFLKPRIKFDDINPLDLSIEKEFEEDWYYTSKKVKTILIFNLNIPYMENGDEILKYIKEENIWGEVKDLINFFLSIYTFIRINSNFKECPIFPLGNDYYTHENTVMTYKTGSDSPEFYLDKMNIYLQIPIHYNYHTLISGEKTLDFFKERFSRRRDLKLKLDERMEILIEFAKRMRDINSIIINTCIYLERISIEYLSFKKELDKSELDILYKEKGLTHFVESQLPHFLENEVDSQIIKDSIELVRLRNEIMHYGSDFSFREDLELKCDNTLKLIKCLEDLIRFDKEKLEFNFKGKPVGRVLEIGPENLIKLLQFESELEANYNSRNEIILNKIPEKFLRKFLKISDEFQIFQLPDEFSAYCRIFFKDKNHLMVFALNPTQNHLNFDLLEKTLLYLKDNIDLKELTLSFITQHIPTGTLNLFKKVAEKKIGDFKQELNINLEFNYYSFIQFKDSIQQELFAKVLKLFNVKEDSIISEEEILKSFDKKEIEDLFSYYPDFFQKKIIEEKIFWIIHGKLKDMESLT